MWLCYYSSIPSLVYWNNGWHTQCDSLCNNHYDASPFHLSNAFLEFCFGALLVVLHYNNTSIVPSTCITALLAKSAWIITGETPPSIHYIVSTFAFSHMLQLVVILLACNTLLLCWNSFAAPTAFGHWDSLHGLLRGRGHVANGTLYYPWNDGVGRLHTSLMSA